MTYRKKLIEVSLPRKRSTRNPHARNPSARAPQHPAPVVGTPPAGGLPRRALVFAVDDPSEYMPDEESANRERERLSASSRNW